MKKLLLSAALVSMVSLGGCATIESALPNLPAEIATVTSQTQAIAAAVCAFEPTAATVGAVVASLFPNGGAIDAMANAAADAICKAVTSMPVAPVAASATLGPNFPMVNGVVIEGHFINKARLHSKKSLKLGKGSVLETAGTSKH